MTYLIEEVINYTPEFFTEGYLNDRHRALYDDGLSFRDFIYDAEFKKLCEEFNSEDINNITEELILQRDDIIEECICDDIALENLVLFLSKNNNIDIQEIVKAIFLGLENLELLSIIDKLAVDFIHANNDKVIGFINESIIRVSNFRNYMHANPVLIQKVNDKEFHEDFKKINMKYSELIKDPILFGLKEKIQTKKDKYDSIEIDDKESDLALRL